MKKIFIIIAILIVPFICLAQQYTVDQLIEIGLEKSYDIQLETVNRNNSESQLRSSIYGVLPSLTAGVGKTKYYDQVGSTDESDWYNNASLSLSKSFFLNEPSFYNINSSIYSMKNAKSSFNETRKQIAYYIFTNYLGILELQETLEIQKKNLKLQDKIHKQIQTQYETGNKSLLELKQSQLSLIDYQINVNEAENNLSKSRKDLFSYLNIPDEGFEFTVPDISYESKTYEFTSNNLLDQKMNSLKINKLQHLQTTLNLLPTLSVSYQFNHNDNDDIYDFSEYTRDSQSLSLNASWNVFGLMDNLEQIGRSKRNLRIQKLDYVQSKNNYQIKLQNLQKDLMTLKESSELYDNKLELAKETLNMAQEQFRLGMISLLDLDRSKIDFQNTQLANIQNKYELLKKQEEINLLLSEKILGKW